MNLAKEKYYELEEIERTIEELGLQSSPLEILRAFRHAHEIILPNIIWSELKNTDYDVVTEFDVKKKLVMYDKSPLNYDRILGELESGIMYPALIMKLQDESYYLVAGNTRLMVCKVNNIAPKVKIIKNIK